MIDEQGAALACKMMAFRSGSDKSTLYINRTIENAGGTPFVYGDRAGVSLGFTVLPDKAIDLVPLLAIECSFEKWDIRDARALVKMEAAEAYKSAQVVLTEAINAAAFGPQSPAGRPYYSTDASVEKTMSFYERSYGLQGAYLVATGIKDHDAFCKAVNSALSDAPAGEKLPFPKMEYLGGESRVAAPSAGYAHVAMAFAAPEDMVLANVVKNAFSVLGMGSGVTGFSSAGLVGLYAGGTDGGAVADAMSKAVTGTISPDIVKRAKRLAKAEALFAIDGGSQLLCQYMTESVMSTCKYSGPADVIKDYDAVTDEQVKGAFSTMLKSNPSLAAIGNISQVPYHATIASRFK
jgi:predicted Zn-dependent peptidase